MESSNNDKRRTWVFWPIVAVILTIVLVTLSFNTPDDRPSADPQITDEPIIYSQELSKVIDAVYTTKKQMALTFNGMADRQTMRELLDELERYDMQATFFLPGMRVAEEPDIAQLIVERGHEIANNTLQQADMSMFSYEQIFRDLQLANQVFADKLGIQPKYVRTRSGDYTDNVRYAAHALGMEAVVSASINPRDRDMQSAEELAAYVERFLHRGAVVTMNTDLNPNIVSSIRYLADVAKRSGFTWVTLEELVAGGGERKPLEQIPGFDAAVMNLQGASDDYVILDRLPNGRNEVVLTFDDWGSEQTINRILDILQEHEVEATFFVTAQGVEYNPNLARAVIEAGHEIANHTYSHRDVTELTAEELQVDIVKAHHTITYAIQEQPLMIFRPPTGAIDEASARTIAQTGYRTIALFDVTALDWDVSRDAATITSTILQKTVDGSFILLHLHDGIHTADALPDIITGLRSRGFQFVKMSDLLANQLYE